MNRRSLMKMIGALPLLKLASPASAAVAFDVCGEQWVKMGFVYDPFSFETIRTFIDDEEVGFEEWSARGAELVDVDFQEPDWMAFSEDECGLSRLEIRGRRRPAGEPSPSLPTPASPSAGRYQPSPLPILEETVLDAVEGLE